MKELSKYPHTLIKYVGTIKGIKGSPKDINVIVVMSEHDEWICLEEGRLEKLSRERFLMENPSWSINDNKERIAEIQKIVLMRYLHLEVLK